MTGEFFVPHDLEAPLRGAVTGPLAGLTAVVKEMYDIAGTRTGAGSPDWLADQKPAVRHAAAVERILNAGATIVGKTICDEFFYSLAGINVHYGTPANLRAPNRIPGGSSSGSAAACSANACDFALGSDTGGSIRIPASFNGLYGLRPTHGRVDSSGMVAMAPSFDVVGWFANAPGIFRKVGATLLNNAHVSAPITQLLIATDAFAQADLQVAALAHMYLKRVSHILPQPADIALAHGKLDEWREAFRIVQAREVWRSFGEFVMRVRPKLGPGIKERMEHAANVTDTQASDAGKFASTVRNQVREILKPGTILALPTAPSIAPLVDLNGHEMELFRVRALRLTCIAGLAGLPQMNLPIGTVGGCPAGLSLIGWPGGDEALLDLTASLAQHCGIVLR